MGHINEDLSVLISRYLTRRMITPQLARKLLRLLFTFKVDCLSPDMKKVIVADTRRSRESMCLITDHMAQVRIYSEQSRILLEDEQGRRYTSTALYMARHLLDDTALMNQCVQAAADDPSLVMFFTLNPRVKQPITHKTLKYYIEASRMAAFSENYREQLKKWLLSYYYDNPQEETLSVFLRESDADTYARIDRGKYLALLTQDGRYERAWTVLEKYGMQDVDLNLLELPAGTVLRFTEEDSLYHAVMSQAMIDGWLCRRTTWSWK